MQISYFLRVCFCLLLVGCSHAALRNPASSSTNESVAVWTHHNDNFRTGTNLHELELSPSSLIKGNFGKLFTLPVEGDVYAQLLYVPGLKIQGKKQNVLFVVTHANVVYAFDADEKGPPLWQRRVGTPVLPNMSFHGRILGVGGKPYGDMEDSIGITGTPVIDLSSKTIYFVSFIVRSDGTPDHVFHALDLETGSEKYGAPVSVAGSMPGVGVGSVSGSIAFQSFFQNQRPALLLNHGRVYVAFASFADAGPYHGWIFSFDARNVADNRPEFITTPDGEDGGSGIWMSGSGPSADLKGNIYFTTGNGSVTTNLSAPPVGDRFDYGNSVLKVHPTKKGMKVKSFFTPYDYEKLNAEDLDLGVSGITLTPDDTNVAFWGSKDGKLYVASQDDLGGLKPKDAGVLQSFQVTPRISHYHHGNMQEEGENYCRNLHGSPIYWNSTAGKFVYMMGESDHLKAFRLEGKTFPADIKEDAKVVRSFSHSADKAPDHMMPGGFISLSANGEDAESGVVWLSYSPYGDANKKRSRGILQAYKATDLSVKLWDSRTDPADEVGNMAKFCPPTVVAGKVYLATFSNQVHVYGFKKSN